MIKIELDRRGNKSVGNFNIRGDYETITGEIYAVLVTFARECPEAFEDAVKMHPADMMKARDEE